MSDKLRQLLGLTGTDLLFRPPLRLFELIEDGENRSAATVRNRGPLNPGYGRCGTCRPRCVIFELHCGCTLMTGLEPCVCGPAAGTVSAGCRCWPIVSAAHSTSREAAIIVTSAARGRAQAS